MKLEFPPGWEELTAEEANTVIAGASMTYWLGYLSAKISNLFS